MSNPEPIPVPPLAVALATLAECLCTELAAVGITPCFCGVVPGQEVALDFCAPCDDGTCGMAWVRLDISYPSDTWPFQSLDDTCRKPLAYRIEAGAAHCVPIHEDGEPLSEAEALDVTITQVLAMDAIRRALTCCTSDYEVTIEGYQPFGPQGGCVGGVWSAYLGLP